MKTEEILNEISIILDNSIDEDWGFDGENEVMSIYFNKDYAMYNIAGLLTKHFRTSSDTQPDSA